MQVNQHITQLLTHSIQKGGLEITAEGYSMYPLIQQGDLCRFAACSPDDLKKGDIVLFRNHHHQLVAHRLVNGSATGGVRVFLFRGDTNLAMDPPVREHQLLGRLTAIKRSRYAIRTDGWAARAWGWVILHVLPIRVMLNKYTRRRVYVERV